MSRLDHIAVYVRDLEGARDFFIRYFGAMSNDIYHNPRTGLKTYFLSFPEGGRLEIMTRPGLEKSTDESLLAGYNHLAIGLGSAEAVDRMTSVLVADGYKLLSGPRTTGDGYYESTILACEGLLLELTV